MDLQGYCPKPFFQETQFPLDGGFIAGRFCLPTPSIIGNISCCLPCPATDWVYSDGFDHRTEIANWVNVAAFVTTVFLLLTFIVLPVKWTNRHYLTVCLATGLGFIELAFLIPLATKPEQCYNIITPNDMHSDRTCAVSGAFLLFGGWTTVIWIFCRALSLHLQICWEVVPGKKFFYTALAFGWSIPVIGLGVALGLTGVSYRFGNVCHINHENSLQGFWGPLLAFSAASLVLQFITMGYCIQVYVRSLMDEKATTDTSSHLPSYSGSMRTLSARQAYRRVKRIIQLQWRGVAIVLVILANVIFFSVVFVTMDNGLQINANLLSKATPWLTCLVIAGGEKDQCLSKAGVLVQKESLILAVLITLSASGFWNLIFLGRWSMILGWIDLVKRALIHRHEFVSADARRLSSDPRTYEMLEPDATPAHNIKSPDPSVISPQSYRTTPFSPDEDSKQEYFGNGVKPYVGPAQSFSTPRPPSLSQGREWDSRATYARGMAQPGANLSKNFSM